jgi:hypothetical protein
MYCKTVTTNTIKLHADGNITCKTHWTIQCSRMLEYCIITVIFHILSNLSFMHHLLIWRHTVRLLTAVFALFRHRQYVPRSTVRRQLKIEPQELNAWRQSLRYLPHAGVGEVAA